MFSTMAKEEVLYEIFYHMFKKISLVWNRNCCLKDNSFKNISFCQWNVSLQVQIIFKKAFLKWRPNLYEFGRILVFLFLKWTLAWFKYMRKIGLFRINTFSLNLIGFLRANLRSLWVKDETLWIMCLIS